MSGVSEDDLISAIDRIGMTPDGELLYLFLQKRLTRVLHTLDSGALQSENGQRTLAAELMGHLSTGIQEAHAGIRSDRIAVFKLPERAALQRARGATRRGFVAGAESEFGPGTGTEPGGDAA
jgi:hypothetical protein